MRTFGVAIIFCVFLSLAAKAYADDQVASLPLHLHTPGERVLVIAGGEELQGIVEVLKKYQIPFEHTESFDKNRQDYRGIFAIIAGSNRVDYFGSPENRADEAFTFLDEFVRAGGHLFCFGAFNGRNFHHFTRYGVRTGSKHGWEVAYNQARAEVFFHGLDEHLPDHGKLHLVGTLTVNAPYVTMLARGRTVAEGTPVLATLGVGAGRISILMAEPYYMDSMWILPVACHWVCRGAPTTIHQLSEVPVVSPFALREHRMKDREQLADDRIKIIQEEFRDIHTPDEFMSRASAATDKDRQFVALLLAAEKYADVPRANSVEGALLAASQLYWFDLLKTKARLLKHCEANCVDETEAAEIARLSLNAYEDALDLYRIAEAHEFTEIATRTAQLSGSNHYQYLAEQALAQIEPIHRAWLRVSESLQDLQTHPADPRLNTVAGRFFAFVATDWDIGLACLAHGDDETLRDLATLSLAHSPSLLQQLRVADRWQEYAGSLEGIEKANVERKARELYLRIHESLSQLTSQDQDRVRNYLDRAPKQSATLSVELTLDGYGFLTIRQHELFWETQSGTEPEVMRLNTQQWNRISIPRLINRGATRYLPDDVDFSAIQVDKTFGRGIVRVERQTPDEVVLRLNDLPNGRGEYKLTIRFGP